MTDHQHLDHRNHKHSLELPHPWLCKHSSVHWLREPPLVSPHNQQVTSYLEGLGIIVLKTIEVPWRYFWYWIWGAWILITAFPPSCFTTMEHKQGAFVLLKIHLLCVLFIYGQSSVNCKKGKLRQKAFGSQKSLIVWFYCYYCYCYYCDAKERGH